MLNILASVFVNVLFSSFVPCFVSSVSRVVIIARIS